MLVLLSNKTHLRILFHITLSAVRALGMRGLPISCRVLALWHTIQFARIKTRCGIRGGPADCGWPSEEGSLIPTRILPLKRSTPSSAQTWHCWQFKSSGCGVTRALRPSTTSPVCMAIQTVAVQDLDVESTAVRRRSRAGPPRV